VQSAILTLQITKLHFVLNLKKKKE